MSSFGDAGIAFLEGFLGAKAKKLERADEKAQRYYDMQMELASRNLPKIKAADTVVNNALGVVNQVKSMYGTDDMIKAAQSMGPDGLVELRNKMASAQKQLGGVWNPEYVKDIWGVIPDEVRNSEAFLEYSGTDTTDFIRKSMGRGSYTVGDFKAPKDSFFSRLDGRNKMARTRQELDQMEFAEGMSAYDINQSANAAQYQSLIPGAFIQYPNARVFDIAAQNSFDDGLSSAIRDVSRYNTNFIQAELNRDNGLESLQNILNTARTSTYDKNIINNDKIKNLRIGQPIDASFKANSSVDDNEFNKYLSEVGLDSYNSNTLQFNNATQTMKEIIHSTIDNKVGLLKINYGESVINDVGLRSILSRPATLGYELPAMVDSNGDAVTEVESTKVIDTPGPSDPKTWKVLKIELTDTDNKFSVKIQDGVGKNGEPRTFTMLVEDPLKLAQVSMPISKDGLKVFGSVDLDRSQEIMAALKVQITESAIDKLIKDKADSLPEFKKDGASVLGKAETETITQIDKKASPFMKDIQGAMSRGDLKAALVQINAKIFTGYDDTPGANIIARTKGYLVDNPDEVKRRNISKRTAKWFKSEQAINYFKQQPNQLVAAAEDPVAWYIRYEAQYLTESK